MDIQLPEISGLEVTKWIKEDDNLKSIPVVAVTAFAMKGDEEKIRVGGCEAYIAKPISVQQFLDTVGRVRKSVPGIALSTDVIVGFPGETDAQFQETFDRLAELPVTYLHPFTYSVRPGST